MAEREGFEPSKQVSPFTRLAGERLQPARPSLRNFSTPFNYNIFEGAGKEKRCNLSNNTDFTNDLVSALIPCPS